MRRFLSFIASLLFVVAPLFAARPAVPTLTVQDDQGNVALDLSALSIRVTMRGHLVRTEYELTFRNAMDRVVGGNFHFPLPADAEVSDLGLYFDDHLRHAVAVERVLARTAYEEIVHRGVDPALVEWSSGRGFDLEVYPIPAKGTKKVFIAYDQELTSTDYVLDLRYGRTIDTFTLTRDVGDRGTSVAGYVPLAPATNVLIDGILRIARDPNPTAFAVQSRKDSQWYASGTLDVTPPRTDAVPAAHVVVLYDTSSSSIQQDAALLRRFLGELLTRQQAWATADLIPFHLTVDVGRRIEKIGTPGGLRELERELDELRPLGATNLISVATKLRGVLDSLPPATRVILVTDGLTSLGDSRDVAAAFAKLAEGRRPLTIVNASPTADDHLLGNAARASGGWWLDLTRIDPIAAAETAMRVPARIRNSDGILPATIVASTASRHVIASRAKQPIVTLRDVPLRVLESEREVDLVRRAWARAKLRELMAAGATDEELIAHGRAFTQLTPRTSLLVLETWMDYERYGIELPPDVAAEKERVMAEQKVNLVVRNLPPPAVVTKDDWFVHGRVLEGSGLPLPGVTVMLMSGDAVLAAAVTNADGQFVVGMKAQPQDARLVAQLEGFNRRDWKLNDGVARGTSFDLTLNMAAVSESITVTAEAPALDTTAASASSSVRNASLRRDGGITTDDLLASIATDAATISDDPEVLEQVARQRRVLTREVVAKIRALGSSRERLRYYLSARTLLGGDKSFHVLSAQAFRETSPELAARVLSDLAEARTDDAPLLRILARVLDGWDEPELAELLLRRALEISPGEPQTWRELILLEARRGRGAEVQRWARRMNAVKKDDWGMEDLYQITEEAVARFRGASFLDQRRGLDIRLEPGADLTVEAMYDTGWSWVDVHVTEPGGNVVSWANDESDAGGKLTGGYIFGYGPQTYSIRNAPRGTYHIAMDYYAEDDTKVSLESLVHIVITIRTRHGLERTDHFLVLGGEEEKLEVAKVRLE